MVLLLLFFFIFGVRNGGFYHGLDCRIGNIQLFHQDGAKSAFPHYVVARTAHIQINFIVPVRQDSPSSQP
jgi:hypothetical protein